MLPSAVSLSYFGGVGMNTGQNTGLSLACFV